MSSPKVRYLVLDRSVLADLLSPNRLVQVTNLPDDFRIEDIRSNNDCFRDGVHVLISSESFSELQPGDPIPHIVCLAHKFNPTVLTMLKNLDSGLKKG